METAQMKKIFMWIGVATVLGFVAPVSRAERPNGPVAAALGATIGHAAAASDSWVIMAGCPEACPPSGRRARLHSGCAAAMLDGNTQIMQLNLEQDGLDSTREIAPSFDPGAGEDLAWALNRSNDGLGARSDGNDRRAEASPAITPAWQPSDTVATVLGKGQGIVETNWFATMRLTAWARDGYEGAITGIQRHWHATARALGIALIQSWVAISTAASREVQAIDPELQAPLDPLTAAWVESVRTTESAGPAVEVAGATVQTADDRSVPSAQPMDARQAANVGATTATAVTGDQGGISESLPAAPDALPNPIGQSSRAFDSASPPGIEIGCGAIGLPRPIDAPERARRISY
jgi:hypothetical protein